jgi:hypothetical protein
MSRSALPLVLTTLALTFTVAPSAQTPAAAGDPIFDGKTLTNWKPSTFSGQGKVTIENGEIVLSPGNDLTGITWSGAALPTTNYELTLEARRMEGRDFFAGITFPVDDSFCSLILGGWGGNVVGLSSINSMDASENSTSQSREFEMNRWYRVRIRVTPAKIESWLDDRQIIDQELKGNKIDIRIEVDPSKPMGIATWRTKGGLRNIRLRRL